MLPRWGLGPIGATADPASRDGEPLPRGPAVRRERHGLFAGWCRQSGRLRWACAPPAFRPRAPSYPARERRVRPGEGSSRGPSRRSKLRDPSGAWSVASMSSGPSRRGFRQGTGLRARASPVQRQGRLRRNLLSRTRPGQGRKVWKLSPPAADGWGRGSFGSRRPRSSRSRIARFGIGIRERQTARRRSREGPFTAHEASGRASPGHGAEGSSLHPAPRSLSRPIPNKRERL